MTVLELGICFSEKQEFGENQEPMGREGDKRLNLFLMTFSILKKKLRGLLRKLVKKKINKEKLELKE